MIFEDRKEAGVLLSSKLTPFQKESSLILAIPRGGVVVGKAIADQLNLPLDILVVRKIGAPENPELAIGAVGPENTIYLDQGLIERLGIKKYPFGPSSGRGQISNIKYQKFKERLERERALRGIKPYDIKNKTIILVDDGVATGATVIVAAKFLRKKKAKKIILAVPVIAYDTSLNIKKYFDEVVFLDNPSDFYAVGQFYRDFPQVSDDEVICILNSKPA